MSSLEEVSVQTLGSLEELLSQSCAGEARWEALSARAQGLFERWEISRSLLETQAKQLQGKLGSLEAESREEAKAALKALDDLSALIKSKESALEAELYETLSALEETQSHIQKLEESLESVSDEEALSGAALRHGLESFQSSTTEAIQQGAQFFGEEALELLERQGSGIAEVLSGLENQLQGELTPGLHEQLELYVRHLRTALLSFGALLSLQEEQLTVNINEVLDEGERCSKEQLYELLTQVQELTRRLLEISADVKGSVSLVMEGKESVQLALDLGSSGLRSLFSILEDLSAILSKF